MKLAHEIGRQKFILYAILVGEYRGKRPGLRLECNLTGFVGGRNVDGIQLAQDAVQFRACQLITKRSSCINTSSQKVCLRKTKHS
jgi:hypothetical protein